MDNEAKKTKWVHRKWMGYRIWREARFLNLSEGLFGLFAQTEIEEQLAPIVEQNPSILPELVGKAPFRLEAKIKRLRGLGFEEEAAIGEAAYAALVEKTERRLILRGYGTGWDETLRSCTPADRYYKACIAVQDRLDSWYVLDIWDKRGQNYELIWTFILVSGSCFPHLEPWYFIHHEAKKTDPERYARELIFAPNNISPLRISPVFPAGTMLRVKAAPFFPKILTLAVSREQVAKYGIPDMEKDRTLTDLQDGALFGTELRNIVPLIYCLAPADKDHRLDGSEEPELWDHAKWLSAHAPGQTAELLVHYKLMLDHLYRSE